MTFGLINYSEVGQKILTMRDFTVKKIYSCIITSINVEIPYTMEISLVKTL